MKLGQRAFFVGSILLNILFSAYFFLRCQKITTTTTSTISTATIPSPRAPAPPHHPQHIEFRGRQQSRPYDPLSLIFHILDKKAVTHRQMVEYILNIDCPFLKKVQFNLKQRMRLHNTPLLPSMLRDLHRRRSRQTSHLSTLSSIRGRQHATTAAAASSSSSSSSPRRKTTFTRKKLEI